MKRPLPLTIVAWLFILSGASATWDVVSSLFTDRISLNLAVCMLPVGIGLLKGNPDSAFWAKFWIGLSFLGALVLVVMYPIYGDRCAVNVAGHMVKGTPRHVVSGLFLLAILAASWKAVGSAGARAFFRSRSPLSKPS